MTDDTRRLFILLRAALIQALGAIEDVLGIPRSVVTQRQRERAPK